MYIINENDTYDFSDVIQNILESEMANGESLSITAACKHYVELIHFKFNDDPYRTIQLVDDRNIENIKLDKDIIGFQFYDIESAFIQIGEKQYNLTTGKKNMSPVIYKGNRILLNDRSSIVCHNGYVITNPNREYITVDEINSINGIQKSNVYTKKKAK